MVAVGTLSLFELSHNFQIWRNELSFNWVIVTNASLQLISKKNLHLKGYYVTYELIELPLSAYYIGKAEQVMQLIN